jgi:serine/threonine protein kinase
MASNEQTRGDDDRETDTTAFFEENQSIPLTPQSPSFFERSAGDDGALDQAATVKDFGPRSLPIQFGNYTLIEVVGEGGAGIVFKAKPDPNHASANSFEIVAMKLIRPEIIASQKAAKRFEKESRLHAEVNSPYIPRFLEYGCERGFHYIASEFVDGVGLDKVINLLKTFPAKQSLRIAADLLKALAALHLNGVIHRDVKPGNVLISLSEGRKPASEFSFEDFEIAKLTDFGLARHIEQSESLAMTRQRTMLGTPLYMAPEQNYESRTVDERADIYSVGVTLYQMLTGRPPFDADDATELAELHRVEHPKPLTLVREGTSEAVNNIVMKALEKEPSLRYQDASEMLADVEKVLDDQPIGLRLYPETPDKFHPAVRGYDFQWTLNATTKELWPLVSDTDRFNQAIGLPAPTFSYDHSGSQRKIFASANFNGMKVRWREHPFQWILEREMSVLREFESGPFEWVTSTVELHPLAGNRTRLIHCFQVKPRGWFGKLMTPIQFNFMTKRSLNRVYAQLEEIANDKSCGYACDVSFSKPIKLSPAQQKLLMGRQEELATHVSNRKLTLEFAEFLGTVSDAFAARIRPIPLAEKLNCSLEESLQICLRGVEVGLVNMSWDVICPVCRISASNVSSLTRVQGHSHCEVCNLDFEVDFSKSVEVIFSVHPEIRQIELKTYCIGGPFHAPHVIAQNRLLANQFVDVGTVFAPGNYEICGPQIIQQTAIKVRQDAIASRAEVVIGGVSATQLPDLQPGAACIHIENESQSEILVRLEQAADREASVTAATACQLPLFRQLFPAETVEPAGLIDLSNVYLLAIKLLDAEALIERVGEIQVREYWTQLQTELFPESPDGEVIECTHESLLIKFNVFDQLTETLNSILSLKNPQGLPVEQCCFAISSGEIMTGSQTNQPVAFGKTIREIKRTLSNVTQCSVVLPSNLYQMIASSDSISDDAPIRAFRTSGNEDDKGMIHLKNPE